MVEVTPRKAHLASSTNSESRRNNYWGAHFITTNDTHTYSADTVAVCQIFYMFFVDEYKTV